MDESLIWKDVVGFEGLYSVSYCGIVYSHPRSGSNGGLDNPCHLDVYNKLITMERELNERAAELLK